MKKCTVRPNHSNSDSKILVNNNINQLKLCKLCTKEKGHLNIVFFFCARSDFCSRFWFGSSRLSFELRRKWQFLLVVVSPELELNSGALWKRFRGGSPLFVNR